ncbi:MAG: ROK family transcriptional regulator [Treponema sp.]|jgi:predicted NBD/HSP70 family sugar kinase|nr:ROK family transcriptional regulator [Treponema sp.]
MQQFRKIDKIQIAQINKYNVIRCLMREGPINRAAIAKRLGLSIPTVMFITETLLKSTFIRSIGKGVSSGGKPPEMLEIVPERFFYIGLDIGRTMIRAVAVNAVSRQVACVEEPTNNPAPEKKFVDRIAGIILKIAGQLKTENNRILGASIAMPGLIEKETGVVLFSPDFGWNNIPLQEWLTAKIPFPVLLENANRALALNEVFLMGGENSHTTFAVNLGYGIGAALVIGEDLYTGASGTSGEIGHITALPQGPVCHCGNRGCLEAVASGAAIAAQGKSVLESQGPGSRKASKIRELAAGDPEKVDAALVFRARELGDKEAARIVNSAAEHIGIGLSMAINVLDPDRLVLCGGLMRNGPFFLEKIKASIETHRMRQAGRAVIISTGRGGEYSTANGACRVLSNSLWRNRQLPV